MSDLDVHRLLESALPDDLVGVRLTARDLVPDALDRAHRDSVRARILTGTAAVAVAAVGTAGFFGLTGAAPASPSTGSVAASGSPSASPSSTSSVAAKPSDDLKAALTAALHGIQIHVDVDPQLTTGRVVYDKSNKPVADSSVNNSWSVGYLIHQADAVNSFFVQVVRWAPENVRSTVGGSQCADYRVAMGSGVTCTLAQVGTDTVMTVAGAGADDGFEVSVIRPDGLVSQFSEGPTVYKTADGQVTADRDRAPLNADGTYSSGYPGSAKPMLTAEAIVKVATSKSVVDAINEIGAQVTQPR